MKKRILIIGGVAGGASVAARARRLDESAEIIMFEKGPNVSFSNCSLPFHLSGIVEDSESLVLMDPNVFKNQYNIIAKTNSEVTSINRQDMTVTVKDLLTGKHYKESYDKLFLSPGANPIMPNIEGIEGQNVFTVRNVVDIKKLDTYIKQNKAKKISVIGGGFIGVEVGENLALAGYHVDLIEASDQIMAPFDYDMVQILHKEMMDKGVNLVLGDGIKKIQEKSIELSSGRKIAADVVVMAIGVRPETTLAKEAGLEIGQTGAIKVDHNYMTNDENIYAVGDAIEVYNKLTHKVSKLALAGPAQKQARAAADHVFGKYSKNPGVIGSSCVQVFDINAASTGLNEKAAKAANIKCEAVYVIPKDKVGLMPDSNPIHFKLVFEVPTGLILGAQAIGKGNVDKRIDVIAAMITMNAKLEDLKDLELCYSPMFGTAKDVVNFAALVGLNILHGVYKQVPMTEVRSLVQSDAFIVDVREKHEYEAGHLINAINIPLSELRQKMSQIPTDIPVYLHCRSSQRSYNALMALQNSGYKNLYNITGSYVGISNYEYFNDQSTGRDKILTQYNFN